jgi:hypothetical protein
MRVRLPLLPLVSCICRKGKTSGLNCAIADVLEEATKNSPGTRVDIFQKKKLMRFAAPRLPIKTPGKIYRLNKKKEKKFSTQYAAKGDSHSQRRSHLVLTQ